MDLGPLDFYRRSGEIPKAVQEALGKAVTLKQAVIDTQRKMDEDKQKLTDITAEQGRLRDNLKAVEKGASTTTG